MLVTLSQMKAYLGLDSDSTYDSFLSQQINLISEAVEEYCKRKFKKATYLQTFYRDEVPDQEWFKTLTLRQFPLISISSALLKDKTSDTGVALDEYRVNKPTAKLIKECSGDIFSGYKLIQVTYVAGYDKIPAPILDVVYSLVQERYNKKKNGVDLNFGSDVQRVSIPGVISVDYDFSLDNNTRKIALGVILGSYVNVLDSYRSESAVVGTEELIYNDPA